MKTGKEPRKQQQGIFREQALWEKVEGFRLIPLAKREDEEEKLK